jgi:acetamidase/formamidase
VIGEWTQPEGEAARSLVEGGIGKLDLRRASAPIGAGRVAPEWLFSPGLAATAQRAVLQPGAGKVEGRYVRSTPETVHRGRLPGPESVPAATVASGAVVTIDTVAHEGLHDPVAFFAAHGIPAAMVLDDAKALAPSPERDGPCVVTGPVAVRDAAPGDILKVDVLGLVPRVPYGVVSSRVSRFTPVHRVVAGSRVQLRAGVPLDPGLGVVGVAGDPLTTGDGLGVGSSLYLPVLAPGAKFFVGDPHYARDGANVLKAPLRAIFRLTVLPRGTALPKTAPAGYWAGRVDAHTKQAIDESMRYLQDEHTMTRAVAFAYLAAAGRAV